MWELGSEVNAQGENHGQKYPEKNTYCLFQK